MTVRYDGNKPDLYKKYVQNNTSLVFDLFLLRNFSIDTHVDRWQNPLSHCLMRMMASQRAMKFSALAESCLQSVLVVAPVFHVLPPLLLLITRLLLHQPSRQNIIHCYRLGQCQGIFSEIPL